MTTTEEKKNPHLEELAEIITFIEASRDDLNSETLTKKLKELHSGMDSSPLVLKMRPRGLRIAESKHYKWQRDVCVKNQELHEQGEKEEITAALLAVVGLSHWMLEMAEGREEYESVAVRTLSKVLWGIEGYLKDHVALHELDLEERALACLCGSIPGVWGYFNFEGFAYEIEKVEKENTGGKGGNKDDGQTH
ncbi:MAG: hypothetical protein V3W51_00075 [Candidatus Brocadiales bacterium]